MKLVVGLGNPGKDYEATRHNVGFGVADTLVRKFSIFSFQFSKKFEAEIVQADAVMLVKPQTFMNRSGETVQKVMQFFKIAPADLLVVHDDLDITLGDYKINLGVGPKVHNGINSIREAIGKDFWYVRVGIDPTKPRLRGAGADFVLSSFTEAERPIINEVIQKVADELISRHL
jgi:peptidyl-tRNA hydrolase, PTH1 family